MSSYRSYPFGMKRALWITGLLALLMALAVIVPTPVQAQDITPRHTDPAWQAQYWNNPTLSGQPSLVRTDNDINFEWGFGAPAPGINADNFSVRWTRYIDVTPGTYRFSATSDDGIRVWVDGQLLIDAWKVQPPTLYTGTIYLGPGHHLVLVEYFEQNEGATAKVSWQMVQQDDPGPGSGPWRGEYFNNVTLSGSPVLIRQEQAIDFNWGEGSPSPLVDVNGFSARWSRTLDLPAGNYRFRILVDDGARLFVNGHTLIDAWKEQAPTTYTGDIYLPGGAITIQMEYFERAEAALAQLTWERIDGQQPITQWKGEYWNNISLSGTPALVRNEPSIDFNWGNGSPAPNLLGTDRFSARWSRTLDLSAGWYRFVMTVDDGGRLYLGDRLVIDAWRDQASTSYDTSIYHGGGPLPVRMDYYENTQVAAAKLSWTPLGTTPPGPTPTPVPGAGTVIVDDTDGNFVRGGNASGWNTVNEGYNGRLLWSRNNTQAQSGYNWARWYPNLKSGRYEVSVYIPDRYSTTSNARYWVSHASGYTLRVVNQSTNGGRWVSLGTYNFRGTRDDYVSLADVTQEAYVSRLIAWDAVKWEPR